MKKTHKDVEKAIDIYGGYALPNNEGLKLYSTSY